MARIRGTRMHADAGYQIQMLDCVGVRARTSMLETEHRTTPDQRRKFHATPSTTSVSVARDDSWQEMFVEERLLLAMLMHCHSRMRMM